MARSPQPEVWYKMPSSGRYPELMGDFLLFLCRVAILWRSHRERVLTFLEGLFNNDFKFHERVAKTLSHELQRYSAAALRFAVSKSRRSASRRRLGDKRYAPERKQDSNRIRTLGAARCLACFRSIVQFRSYNSIPAG